MSLVYLIQSGHFVLSSMGIVIAHFMVKYNKTQLGFIRHIVDSMVGDVVDGGPTLNQHCWFQKAWRGSE